jgi:hypothetical protein
MHINAAESEAAGMNDDRLGDAAAIVMSGTRSNPQQLRRLVVSHDDGDV